MGKLAWYKAEPQAFLTATRGMPFELKCAYRLVIDLIYAHDAKLPDDERFIAGQLGCDVRVWRRLRARLVELGKLYVDGPYVRNSRCDKEVTSALASLKQKRTAGLSSADKRRKSEREPNGGNGLDATDVATESQRTLNDHKSKKETLEVNHVELESLTPPPVPPDGGREPTARAALWREMKGWIGGENPGGVIGRWCKLYGEGATIEVYFSGLREEPADRLTWMAGSLERRKRRDARAGECAGGLSVVERARQILLEREAAREKVH